MPSSTPPDSKLAEGVSLAEPEVESLPVRHLSQVPPQPPERKWLIENLWLHSGVGILAGGPKLGKTFLAAELSVAVASGGKALGRFEAKTSGPVLFFGAEDSPNALRNRFEGLLAIRQLNPEQLPIYLVDVPTLRLDDEKDLRRLRGAIERHRPRLLVLDPFVRIATIDENSAAEVSAVLASLRSLQRNFELAVCVVHHCRKSPAAHPTLALRGSGDFAAWSDTNLCLSREGQHLSLFVEHRNAPAPQPIRLRLVAEPAAHLALVDSSADSSVDSPPAEQANPLHEAILRLLAATPHPLPTLHIRKKLGRRNSDAVEALEQLKAQRKIQRTPEGWRLVQEG